MFYVRNDHSIVSMPPSKLVFKFNCQCDDTEKYFVTGCVKTPDKKHPKRGRGCLSGWLTPERLHWRWLVTVH